MTSPCDGGSTSRGVGELRSSDRCGRAVVIILEVIGEDALQMGFVQYDHVVQTLSAYGADDAFAIGILPGRAWCDRDFFDPHAFDALVK